MEENIGESENNERMNDVSIFIKWFADEKILYSKRLNLSDSQLSKLDTFINRLACEIGYREFNHDKEKNIYNISISITNKDFIIDSVKEFIKDNKFSKESEEMFSLVLFGYKIF